jgi:hypothetical protein
VDAAGGSLVLEARSGEPLHGTTLSRIDCRKRLGHGSLSSGRTGDVPTRLSSVAEVNAGCLESSARGLLCQTRSPLPFQGFPGAARSSSRAGAFACCCQSEYDRRTAPAFGFPPDRPQTVHAGAACSPREHCPDQGRCRTRPARPSAMTWDLRSSCPTPVRQIPALSACRSSSPMTSRGPHRLCHNWVESRGTREGRR